MLRCPAVVQGEHRHARAIGEAPAGAVVGVQVSDKAAAVKVDDERSGLSRGPVQASRTAVRRYMEVTNGAQLGPLGSSRCPLCGRCPQGCRSGIGPGGDLPCIGVIQESRSSSSARRGAMDPMEPCNPSLVLAARSLQTACARSSLMIMIRGKNHDLKAAGHAAAATRQPLPGRYTRQQTATQPG